MADFREDVACHEVIRFPSGRDHDTNRIARFTTEWRRRASRLFPRQGTGRVRHSIIHLELGEPDFHPAAPVVGAVRTAGGGGRDRYCSTRGVPALREAIAEYLKRTQHGPTAEQVLVAPGCKMALSLAMMALIEPGDEVLFPHPSFPFIRPSRGLGATAVPYGLGEE
jgi:aspartate/methionine/tyrosine aminotransferase